MATLLLVALLTGCACCPDARLHQQPAAGSDLPESLLIGVACVEILQPHRASRP